MTRPLFLKAAVFVGLLITQTGIATAGEAFTVKMKSVDQYKAVFATVESVDVVQARTRIGGTVKELVIDEGVTVFAGDVVALVEDPKLKLELVAVDARISSLRSQKKLAVLDLNRATKLRKAGAGSQARLDEAQTNVDVVDKNLKAMMAERDLVLQRLSEGKVLAPTTGRVLKVNVTDGAVVLPGEAIGTIAQEAYRLRMHLPERHARFLKAGENVRVGQRGTNDTSKEGTVRQVYPQMDNGRVVADVEVEGLGDFFVGERTAVYVPTGKYETLMIPKNYLFRKFGLAFVTLKGIGEVVVESGAVDGGDIEILSGLNDGDVILSPATSQ
ncbi:MAG: efflux RND transporter periplasmic adaptor subunit [Rhodospirillales bacterium]|nr:efflux RND transporter periplasmic adaptor subunit [Rhodospirillales bacterium]